MVGGGALYMERWGGEGEGRGRKGVGGGRGIEGSMRECMSVCGWSTEGWKSQEVRSGEDVEVKVRNGGVRGRRR